MPNHNEPLPFPTNDVHLLPVRVKVTHALVFELAFPGNATEQAIKQFVTDRIAVAATLGPCVKSTSCEISPVQVIGGT